MTIPSSINRKLIGGCVSVFKKYKGKRITPKDKNWSKGTWYVWKRIHGQKKPIHKAIKEARTKEQAELAERKIIEQVFNKKYGVGSQEKFGEFVERVYKNYVRQNNVNLATKAIYIRLLHDVFGGRHLTDVTPQDCRNAQANFRKRYAASTVNQLMSTTSKIFTLACQEGILDKNPMQFVTRLKEPPPRDRLLSKEEKERLWRALECDELMACIVMLAINCPLRKGQIVAIASDAVDWENGLLSVIASKGRASRFVPLNSSAMNTLRRMRDASLLPVPLKDFRKRWKRALRTAQIENFRFHDLRKMFASDLRRKGAHSKTIQDLFGHSSMRITDVYLPPEFEAMREAVNSLDEKVQETEGVQ